MPVTDNSLAFRIKSHHYARWLPVHISDMANLSTTHPDVYKQFDNGHFAIQKTQHVFSAISIDQCHEQTNALIKGDGGAVGLTENPQALERWMVGGPEISRAVKEFEHNFQATVAETSTNHHEQVPSVQKSFQKDVLSLVSTISEMGNPFIEDSGDLLTLDTKSILNKDVVHTIYSIEDIGKKQYKSFVEERLKSNPNKPLSDIVTKNKLPLFNTPHAKQESRCKEQISSLKTNCALFARLYIACQARDGNLDQFFQHENQKCPPSISDMGQLRHCSKADLLECLASCCPASHSVPTVDAKVLDGAVVVNMLRPGGSRTFADYAQHVFMPYISSQLETVSRVDIVWDRYIEASLKQSTRDRRMQSKNAQRMRVIPSAPIPLNWQSFLRNDKNKEELFHFLSECVRSFNPAGKVLISTDDQSVAIANQIDIGDLDYLQPCSHEEADTRLLLHVAHCSKQGLRKVVIRTVDTDVVVLAIGHFDALELDELWISFGVGSHYRHIPIHAIAEKLGDRKAHALMFFHAISGCDTVSGFLGRGKKSAWSAWTACPEVTDAFLALSSMPHEVYSESLNEIERFIIVMYSRTCALHNIDEARKHLFAQGSHTIENIPPTKAALVQHIKRAIYQASYVWSQALITAPRLPNPGLWGWSSSEGGWKPFWTELNEASVSCYELVHCGCKKGCKHQCKCRSSSDDI